MEKANTLNQMKQYDFSAPINITMIFDETEDGCVKNISETQVLKDNFREAETEKIHNDNEIANLTFQTHNLKRIKRIDKLSNSYGANSLSGNMTVGHENNDKRTHITNIQLPVIQNKYNSEAPDNLRNVISTEQQLSKDIETLDEKQLLDIVSENLILLIRLYYYYREKCESDSGMITELSKQLDKLKAHFFDLSYSTVVTLILPQENNEIFIEEFLNKMLDKANKAMQCNLVRMDIDPFYYDMIAWIKKKREYLRLVGLRVPSKKQSIETNRNENCLLKEYLACPVLSVTRTTDASQQSCIQTEATPPTTFHLSKTYTGHVTTEDSTSIFAGGQADKEVSRNNNHSSLRVCYEKLPTLKERPVYYNQSRNQVQYNDNYQRNIICNNSVPPPYYGNQSVASNMNLPCYQSTVISAQHYETPQSQYTVCEEFGGPATPIITNVTSLNPSHTSSLVGRCCICGKTTTSRCSKCYDYSYCSSLCQEIDSSTHKSSCRGIRRNNNCKM